MPGKDLSRTLIIGNAGTGKTWLADRLANALQRPAIHLDDLRWQSGSYGVARDNRTVMDEVAAAGEADAWLMEGVYGWLAKVVLQRATTLVWIDLPESECIANVTARGIQGGGSEAAFAELLTWISKYRIRTNHSCFAAHTQLFDAFTGERFLLRSRAQMSAFLSENI
jgi:adenylate kinase family enzyme